MARPAIIIVDMIKDNMPPESPFRKIIPNLQRLLFEARRAGSLIVFANDSFLPADPLFQGRKPHALRGTEGVKVIAELEPQESDIILEKRRFGAFFKTDLDITLTVLGVDTIAVGGITTPVCVLHTVLGGMSNDFKVILLEDCCASFTEAEHDALLNIYRNPRLQPMLRIMTLDEFCSKMLA